MTKLVNMPRRPPSRLTLIDLARFIILFIKI